MRKEDDLFTARFGIVQHPEKVESGLGPAGAKYPFRSVARAPQAAGAEDLEVARPFVLEGRRDHYNDRSGVRSGPGNRDRDRQGNERLSHPHFVSQDQARLLLEPAENFFDSRNLTPRILL